METRIISRYAFFFSLLFKCLTRINEDCFQVEFPISPCQARLHETATKSIRDDLVSVIVLFIMDDVY